MVAPGRVELPTFGLGNRCSIHLSYGANVKSPHYLTTNYRDKRSAGILPAVAGATRHAAAALLCFGAGLWLCRNPIQVEIQFQHVDARFSEQPQVSLISVLLNQVTNR